MKTSKSDLQKLTAAMEYKNLSVAQVIELIEGVDVQSEKVVDTANEIKLIVDYILKRLNNLLPLVTTIV